MAQFPQTPMVGPVVVKDGQSGRLRAERTGATVVQQMHGQYSEDAIRGATWTTSTPIAGVTVTASAICSAASAMPIVGLYNPTGSGVNLVLEKVVCANQGATALTFVLGVASQPAMTIANGLNTGTNMYTFTAGGHKARNFVGATAMAGTPTVFRYIGGGATGALGAGVVQSWTEFVEGDVVIPPGNFLGLFSTVATTSSGAAVASLTWIEVPV